MNCNIKLKCEVCESVINLRWQVGHLERTPVSISCPHCKTLIKLELMVDKENIKIDFNSKNAHRVIKDRPDFYAETSSELLTFKIQNQNFYLPGYTPFIRSIQMIGDYEGFQTKMQKTIYLYENYRHIYERVNKLYFDDNKEFLIKEINKHIEQDILDLKSSNEDIIKQLYKFNISYYDSFFHKDEVIKLNQTIILKNINLFKDEKRENYKAFLKDYCENNKIRDYEKKAFRAIGSILNNYNYFIPAMFMKYLPSNKLQEVYEKYTLTTVDFNEVKGIYITIYENILEILDLIISLNNLLYRDDYNKMTDKVSIRGENIKTIEKFRTTVRSKGYKLKFIDSNEEFYKLVPVFDRRVRNSIGHEDWDYDPFKHMIYMENDQFYLLEYVYKCWDMLSYLIAIYIVIQDIKLHYEMLCK